MDRKIMALVTVSMLMSSVAGAVEQVDPAKQKLRDSITKEVIGRVKKELRAIDQSEPKIRRDLGEFYLREEATSLTQTTEDVIKTILNRAYTNQTPGISKGDHGKSIACLVGSITFNRNIPEELQRGVVIPGAVYEVESRLSNAEDPGRSDRSSTSQGVALKLKNISKNVGTTKARLPDFKTSDEQDFLMTSASTFFLSNIIEYAVAFGIRASNPGPIGIIKALTKHPKLFARLGVEAAAKISSWSALAPGNPDNIMTHPYWSKHPYAWGDRTEKSRAAKYSVAPCENARILTKHTDTEEYQKEFISEALDLNEEVCFNLRVQLRPIGASEIEFPIEDGNVEWNEQKAPFITVAQVNLPLSRNSDWRSDEAQVACAKTEFSPWNGLEAHQPMSNLARGRRYVYKASALVRQIKPELDVRIKAAQ